MKTLLHMKGRHVGRTAEEILAFLDHRGIQDAVPRYLRRTQDLHRLQEQFEKSGRYAASSYAEVPSLDLESYNLALLLSFVVTVHRFEILERLIEFLGLPSAGPSRLLSVGYGTGYELKLARQHLQDWEIQAFECSPEVAAYAHDLLTFFGQSTDCLRVEEFPLENERGIETHEGRFGKAVLCEILEHLERPDKALRNMRRVLHPEGHVFLTMAINIAQEDHVFLYRTPEAAREQVVEAGLRPVHEWVAPVTVFPFDESNRRKIFKKGNYICVATPA